MDRDVKRALRDFRRTEQLRLFGADDYRQPNLFEPHYHQREAAPLVPAPESDAEFLAREAAMRSGPSVAEQLGAIEKLVRDMNAYDEGWIREASTRELSDVAHDVARQARRVDELADEAERMSSANWSREHAQGLRDAAERQARRLALRLRERREAERRLRMTQGREAEAVDASGLLAALHADERAARVAFYDTVAAADDVRGQGEAAMAEHLKRARGHMRAAARAERDAHEHYAALAAEGPPARMDAEAYASLGRVVELAKDSATQVRLAAEYVKERRRALR